LRAENRHSDAATNLNHEVAENSPLRAVKGITTAIWPNR
jgi:hypothetical protein